MAKHWKQSDKEKNICFIRRALILALIVLVIVYVCKCTNWFCATNNMPKEMTYENIYIDPNVMKTDLFETIMFGRQ